MKKKSPFPDSALLKAAESKTFICDVCGRTEHGEKPPNRWKLAIFGKGSWCSDECEEKKGG